MAHGVLTTVDGGAMGERFRLDDSAFEPVPPGATDADPVAAVRDLYYRVGSLERTLEEERSRAASDLEAMLLDLLAISDQVSSIVERWGVSTSGHEAMIVGAVLALGKGVLGVLSRHQVTPIETLGKPYQPSTCDAVGTEERVGLPPNTVLREVQLGYAWPRGLLRRAQVVISTTPSGSDSAGGSTDASSMGVSRSRQLAFDESLKAQPEDRGVK